MGGGLLRGILRLVSQLKRSVRQILGNQTYLGKEGDEQGQVISVKLCYSLSEQGNRFLFLIEI